MKILIFTHNYPISFRERRNAGIFVHDFATELAKTNEVVVICPGSFDKKVKFGQVAVHFFTWRGDKHLGRLRFWNPFDLFYGLNLFFRGIKILSRVSRETKPDFSLAMWAIPGGIFAYFAKIMFGIPYAVWVLGSDFYVYAKIPIIGFFIKYILKNAKYTFADGISLSSEVSKVTKRKCYFLPSSTNFDYPIEKKTIKIRETQLVLTFIGRMEFIKGPDLLIDAILKLKNKINNLKVNFVGDGSLLPVLKQRVKGAGISERFVFFGNVDDPQKIFSILSNSDWLIIPSRSDSIPLVFSEGMKAGTPVIVADLPDLKYLVKKYKIGFSFQAENVNKLSNIIKMLPEKLDVKRKFQQNTKPVVRLFSVQESSRELEEIIKTAL